RNTADEPFTKPSIKKPRAFHMPTALKQKNRRQGAYPRLRFLPEKPVTSQAVGKPLLNSTTNTRRYFQIV
ncbi:MAG: hypothetical protein ABUK14_09325, partial [Desulfobacteria bacterium]